MVLSFPEAVAILLYYAVKFFSACQPREETSPHDSIFRMVATGGFTLMTAICAAFVGMDHYDRHVRSVTRGTVKLEPFGNSASHT
jgi:hypothetical protein